MIIVLDVSAAIEIIFQREKVNKFKSIYNQGTWIIAPDLFIAEITNVTAEHLQKAGGFGRVSLLPGRCRVRGP